MTPAWLLPVGGASGAYLAYTVVAQAGEGGTPDAWTLINTGGVVGLLIVILFGGIRRWWVFGWQHEELRRDRDEWKTYALRGTDLAEKTVDTATAASIAARIAMREVLNEEVRLRGKPDE